MQGAGGVGGLLEVSYYGGSTTTNCFAARDGNGNVTALIYAAAGTTPANYDYGPFGEVIRLSGPMAKLNPFRFSTKYEDDETDLICYPYRYYNPSTGRWLNRDILGEEGANLLYGIGFLDLGEGGGVNLYAMEENNPIHFVDALGLQSVPIGLAEAMASGNVAQVEAILAGMGPEDAGYAVAKAWLKRVSKCWAVYGAYKALVCNSCKGCVTKEQAIANAACWAKVVGLRTAYLAMKCDYCLAGSIAKGSAASAAAHAAELAKVTKNLTECTSLIGSLPSANPPASPTP